MPYIFTISNLLLFHHFYWKITSFSTSEVTVIKKRGTPHPLDIPEIGFHPKVCLYTRPGEFSMMHLSEPVFTFATAAVATRLRALCSVTAFRNPTAAASHQRHVSQSNGGGLGARITVSLAFTHNCFRADDQIRLSLFHFVWAMARAGRVKTHLWADVCRLPLLWKSDAVILVVICGTECLW